MENRTMNRGATLIQIMITISVLAAITIVALPNVLHSKLSANETTAANTLRYIAQAEDHFRDELMHNMDGDDSGEYGTFGLLSGAEPTSRGKPASPPFLDSRFAVKGPGAVVEIMGYKYQLFLPDKPRKTPRHEFTVTDERESFWCAYAWPVEPGKTGRRVYFINQFNLVYSAKVGEVKLPPDPGEGYLDDPFTGEVDITRWHLVQ